MHDPSAWHLLAREGLLLQSEAAGSTQAGSTCISILVRRAMQVLRRLKHASEAGKLPCDDANLTFIVRMLQVGFGLCCSQGCTQSLRYSTQHPTCNLALQTTRNTLECA